GSIGVSAPAAHPDPALFHGFDGFFSLKWKEESTKGEPTMSKGSPGLDRFFRLAESGSNWRREVLAGTTTFLAMAYILLVNPFMLGEEAGMDFGAVFVATAVAS